jgi:hypothetical protein
MIGQVQELAASLFLSVLKISGDHQGTFRLLVTAKVNGEEKPLLIVGNAHGQVKDGHVIAILNPTEELALSNKIVAGTTYTFGLLKKIVSGQCDAMVELWVDAYKDNKVRPIERYVSRSPQPPRFKIR